MNFNIIHESAYAAKVDLLEESIGSQPKIKFKAKLQEKDVVNGNGRAYSDEVLRVITNQLAPKASERKLLGEMDHPNPEGDAAANMKRSSTISLKDVCALYSSLEYDGTFITSVCETLSNSRGMDLYRLLKDQVTIGFSLRAFGAAGKDPSGIIRVQPQGLKALTFDVVSNPSHSSSVIYEFINESTQPFDLIKQLKSHRSNLTEMILEESQGQMLTYTLDGEQTCACDITGSCVQGTIEESIEYLIDIALQKNTIKNFSFKLV